MPEKWTRTDVVYLLGEKIAARTGEFTSPARYALGNTVTRLSRRVPGISVHHTGNAAVEMEPAQVARLIDGLADVNPNKPAVRRLLNQALGPPDSIQALKQSFLDGSSDQLLVRVRQFRSRQSS